MLVGVWIPAEREEGLEQRWRVFTPDQVHVGKSSPEIRWMWRQEAAGGAEHLRSLTDT